jgi:hypothetical protein
MMTVEPDASHTKNLTLVVEISDPFDAAIRILCDAQRFGFSLRNLQIDTAGSAGSTITLGLVVPGACDPSHVSDRLLRHDAVVSVGFVDNLNRIPADA